MPVENTSPRLDGAYSQQHSLLMYGKSGQWLSPAIPCLYSTGYLGLQSGIGDLLVGHSNVLKLGQYFSPPGQGGFSC